MSYSIESSRLYLQRTLPKPVLYLGLASIIAASHLFHLKKTTQWIAEAQGWPTRFKVVALTLFVLFCDLIAWKAIRSIQRPANRLVPAALQTALRDKPDMEGCTTAASSVNQRPANRPVSTVLQTALKDKFTTEGYTTVEASVNPDPLEEELQLPPEIWLALANALQPRAALNLALALSADANNSTGAGGLINDGLFWQQMTLRLFPTSLRSLAIAGHHWKTIFQVSLCPQLQNQLTDQPIVLTGTRTVKIRDNIGQTYTINVNPRLPVWHASRLALVAIRQKGDPLMLQTWLSSTQSGRMHLVFNGQVLKATTPLRDELRRLCFKSRRHVLLAMG